jgi:hypothetical protein
VEIVVCVCVSAGEKERRERKREREKRERERERCIVKEVIRCSKHSEMRRRIIIRPVDRVWGIEVEERGTVEKERYNKREI